MKKIVTIMLMAAALLAGHLNAAEGPTSNMEILRAKMQADKRLLVADAMQLTDAEGKVFWPIYDAHQTDLDRINVQTGKLIARYAAAYNKGAGALTSGQAKQLMDESFALEEKELSLRRTSAAKLAKALSAAQAARYVQIENKLRAALRYELAAEIPLAGIGETVKQ